MEMGVIFVPKHFRDFRERINALGQKQPGPVHFHGVDVFRQGLSCFLLEQLGQVRAIHVEVFGHVPWVDGLVNVPIDVGDGHFNAMGIFFAIVPFQLLDGFQEKCFQDIGKILYVVFHGQSVKNSSFKSWINAPGSPM